MTTEKEKHVLIHSLTGSGDKGVYRNYYAACDGHHSASEIKSLVQKGFMCEGRIIGEGKNNYRYYHVTPMGANAVGLSLDGVES